MRNDFSAAMAQITAEKGLPRDEILNMVAGAMVSAYKRDFGGEEELVAELTPQTGEPRVFAIKLVVETVADSVLEVTLPEALKVDPEASIGISVRIDITPPSFGRIGAQAAKQTIIQRLREAERDHVYHDFIDREGDIVSGIFRRAEPRGMIVDLGRVEALLPPGEQVASERFRIGTRLRALLLEVNRAPRGYLLVASRAHKGFVRRLLELEIPEIYNGSVEIRSIAREPGSRTKVAVQSHQIGLDPVGACVGQRGIRIQNVVNEIGGEKIDVVRWHKETPTMVASALGPARVHNVELSEEDKTAYVTVPHAQFSLAIGKEGQNARLAARLTGWRIDIKSDQPSEEGEAVASAVASPSEGTGSPGSPAPSEEGEAVASAVASPSEGTGSPGSPAPSEEGEAVASAVASPSEGTGSPGSPAPSEEGEAVASAVASPSEGTGSPGSPAPSEEGEAVASAVASPSEGAGSPGSPAPSEEGEAVASAVASPSEGTGSPGSPAPSEEGEAVASAVASPSEGAGSPGSPAPSEEGEAVASAVASPSEGTGSPGSPAGAA